MSRVLVLPFMLNNNPGPYLDELQAAGLEVVYPPKGADLKDPDELLKFLDGIEGVLAGMEPFNRYVFERSNVRAVARMGVGYDAIDVLAATDHNVAVTITPGTNETSVAEHALGLMFGVMRGIAHRDRIVRRGEWKREKLPRIEGKTLGLVGLGRIGKTVVSKAQGLGMKVIAYDPVPDQKFARENEVDLVDLDALLKSADVVSLHSPCNDETKDMINAQSLAKMKAGSVLVNTARGGLVDEQALAEALRSGHLLGAALDVFKQEPPELDNPLLSLENVVLCTHMGGLDEKSEVAMSHLAGKCLADLHQGIWPEHCVVNRSLGSDWQW